MRGATKLFCRPAADLTLFPGAWYCPAVKCVFLFPGQGAQYPGMGKDLFDQSAKVRDLFTLASEVTSLDLQRLLFSGTEDELKATDKTQTAVTLVNLAAAAVLREHGIQTEAVAGFSLGEFAALAEAGVLPAETVLRLVKLRGEVMEKASRALDAPAGNPGMAAVMGLDYPAVAEAIRMSGLTGLYAANWNSPVQTVVSGAAQALEKAEALFKQAGARRFIRLKVSGPFHCLLLEEARAAFAAALAPIAFADPCLPLYSNVSGKRIASGAEAKQLCLRQIVSPVLWVEVERAILAGGCGRVLEVGPGTVLGGLWKALGSDVACQPAGKMEDIAKIA
jgi:[acyl-carrier-protein] S-malonyltransferase